MAVRPAALGSGAPLASLELSKRDEKPLAFIFPADQYRIRPANAEINHETLQNVVCCPPANMPNANMLIGYARVSTQNQNPGRRMGALHAARCKQVFAGMATRKTVKGRPELEMRLMASAQGTFLFWRNGTAPRAR